MLSLVIATFLLSGFTDEDYDTLAPECSSHVWELYLHGERVQGEYDTEEACEAALDELDPQTPPFSLSCRHRWACPKNEI